ncbi:hypothetical protein [Oligoflexus tunisiensis]|uniref:hypothetical protein n=1 Tax=Oligoflexus tunisiensis TaxID=708132 RepID=UPI00114D1966|nr:hypothetical protein [Oligoflexus tunisiensis]
MAVPPNRFSNLSQFWLPATLFVLSVGSIYFTLRHDEDIPVIGPVERTTRSSSDLEARRRMINQALQGSAAWQVWCEKPAEALASVQLDGFHQDPTDKRWTELRRHMPQREQDALLRCQNTERTVEGRMRACLFLGSKEQDPKDTASLHFIEITLELREQGRKKIFSCAEALRTTQPVELAAWYTYAWTTQMSRKPLRFERLTGGTRIFPPLAQNPERSTASSRP